MDPDKTGKTILQIPILLLPLSTSFKQMTARLGIIFLEDLLCLPWSNLTRHPEFTADRQQELLLYLERQDGLTLLKQD